MNLWMCPHCGVLHGNVYECPACHVATHIVVPESAIRRDYAETNNLRPPPMESVDVYTQEQLNELWQDFGAWRASSRLTEPSVPVSALRALPRYAENCGEFSELQREEDGTLVKYADLAALCDAADPPPPESPERADYVESDGPRPPGRDDGRRT